MKFLNTNYVIYCYENKVSLISIIAIFNAIKFVWKSDIHILFNQHFFLQKFTNYNS